MLLSQTLVSFTLFVYALASAITLPARAISSQLDHRVTRVDYNKVEHFTSSETVFGIAKDLVKLQKRRVGLGQLPPETNGQILTEDLVSTRFQSVGPTLNLSINGRIWGYNQRPGYYRFANGTVSDDTSTVDIGKDIASLRPKELKSHLLQSIEGLNNLTYSYLGVKVCGGATGLRQVLDPLRSNETMTAIISNTRVDVGITLNVGSQAVSPSSTDYDAGSAVGFVTIVNNGIIRRISKLDQVDLVDAFVIKIYLALGHRITEQVKMLMESGCVSPHDTVARMNAINISLESMISHKPHFQPLQEL